MAKRVYEVWKGSNWGLVVLLSLSLISASPLSRRLSSPSPAIVFVGAAAFTSYGRSSQPPRRPHRSRLASASAAAAANLTASTHLAPPPPPRKQLSFLSLSRTLPPPPPPPPGSPTASLPPPGPSATNKKKGVFLCSGRLIFGPDAQSLLITISLIVVPIVIFGVFVARHLFHRFPAYDAGYAVLIVAVAFTIYVLVLLLLTSARDPGIIPRNAHPPEEEFSYETSNPLEGGRHTPSLQFPRTKEVAVNGVTVKVKYCDTCMLYRPPRCSHCSICNNCVERFDHHCPWVGQCIGLRNYRYFFFFVSSSTLLCIFVFAMCALYIKFLMDDDYPTVWKAMKHSPASVILMIYCFISLWFVGGLTGFHLYLIGTNQTTYENFRYRTDNRPNVYGRGCASNFLQVFCTSVKPSRNKFRAYVRGEPPRPSPVSRYREPEPEPATEPRSKVEDDLEIGGELLKISRRRMSAEVDEELSIISGLESEHPVYRAGVHNSSWVRRSGSWEISPDILPVTSPVTGAPVTTAPRKEP